PVSVTELLLKSIVVALAVPANAVHPTSAKPIIRVFLMCSSPSRQSCVQTSHRGSSRFCAVPVDPRTLPLWFYWPTCGKALFIMPLTKSQRVVSSGRDTCAEEFSLEDCRAA